MHVQISALALKTVFVNASRDSGQDHVNLHFVVHGNKPHLVVLSYLQRMAANAIKDSMARTVMFAETMMRVKPSLVKLLVGSMFVIRVLLFGRRNI